VAFASGLATAGARPVVAIYSTFLQRGYDQIFQEVLLQNNKVVFVLDRAGIVGEDGATHNGMFDLGYLGVMPGIVLMAPRDATEFTAMLDYALELDGPSAIRIPRGNAPELERCESSRPPIELGRAEVLRQGNDGCLVAYGSMVYPALDAADLLARKGLSLEVVNARFAKPVDIRLLAEVAQRHDRVFTLEEHAVHLGFGSLVLTALAEAGPIHARVIPIGVPDEFIEHGQRGEILRDLGLDAAGIVRRILSQTPVSKASV
jgi:1-deoxy-D-xylulose-5-phosphate synthase